MAAQTTLRLRCSNALPLIVIVLLAAVATGPLPAAGQDVVSNCNGFAVNNVCYTDPRLKECVDRVAPAWPFAGPARPPGGAPKPDCPSPVDDPAGFKACLDAGLPKPLPNATAVVEGCIKSTGVVPAGGAAPAAVTTPVVGGAAPSNAPPAASPTPAAGNKVPAASMPASPAGSPAASLAGGAASAAVTVRSGAAAVPLALVLAAITWAL